MATFTRRGPRWRAQVRRNGISRSRSFVTKAAARAWANRLETEIIDGKVLMSNMPTLAAAATEWAREVAPTHRGAKWDIVRANRLASDPIAKTKLAELNEASVEAWAKRRLQDVKPGTVRREWTTFSSIITYAIRKRWITSHPFRNAKKPPKPPHRDRRIDQETTNALCAALGFDGQEMALTSSQETALAFLLALETGMRQGEICSLRDPDRINLPARYVRLERTKNGDARNVPLSTEAVRLLGLLPKGGFTVAPATVSTLFRRARMDAGFDDLTFHDSRHEACTRLAEKLSLIELARMLGMRDPRTLTIYYNQTATQLAEKLG